MEEFTALVRKKYTPFILVLCWLEPITCSQPSYKGDYEMLASLRVLMTAICYCHMAPLGSSNFKAGENVVLKRYVI